jgi:hypothetical protein
MIKHVLVFPNQMVAVFGDDGQQMSEYQGRWSEMREKILRDKPADVTIEGHPDYDGLPRCQEVLGMVGSLYLRCNDPAFTLVQPRGRSEGPYWLCPEHADHYLRNRDCEDVTAKEGDE